MPYGTQTLEVFNGLLSQDLKPHLDQNNRVVKFEGAENDKAVAMLRPKGRSAELLENYLEHQGFSRKKDAAEALHIPPAAYSMYINLDLARQIPRDILLTVFLTDPVGYDTADADHILMELNRPGLFTTTYVYEENCRNMVLRLLFDYCKKHTEIEPDERVCLLNGLLEEMSRRTGVALESVRAEYWPAKVPEDETLLTLCDTELQSIAASDYTLFRRQKYNEYCAAHPGKNCVLCIADEVYLTPDVVRTILSADIDTENSIGDRDSLIRIAIAMNCDLSEINRMLVESNRSLLYPNDPLDDLIYLEMLADKHN